MYPVHRTILSLLILYVLLIPLYRATLPPTIYYSVTVRSFLQQGCQATWNYPPSFAPSASPLQQLHCPQNSSIIDRIQAGEIGGHLDFQRSTGLWGFNPNIIPTSPYNGKYAKFGKPFPVVAQIQISMPPTPFPAGYTSYSGNPGVVLPYVLADLKRDVSGIPKMQYCEGQDPNICEYNQTENIRTVFNSTTFSTWQHDDNYFNIRSGYQQPVYLTDGQYVFNTYDNYQNPLKNQFYSPMLVYDLPYWPITQEEFDQTQLPGRKKYSFTAEIHSYFQYTGKEYFSFSGDDDVHVYINNRLAIDLGGVHPPFGASIQLKDYEKELNLTVGGVYQFDLFAMERQTVLSDLWLTTTLAATCNVVTTGSRTNGTEVLTAINWTPGGNTNNSDWITFYNPGYAFFNPTPFSYTLMSPGVTDVVSYFFFNQQVDVASGFALTFNFMMQGNGNGFAVIVSNVAGGLTNLNGGTGPNLGIRNMDHSFAVVFDFCPQYPNCESGIQVRLHYNETGGPNSVSNATLHVYEPSVLQNWADSSTHLVQMYYYQNPNWFEVYVDNSLRLVQTDFPINDIVGGNNAWVGFTSTSGYSLAQANLTCVISDVVVQTITEAPKFTEFLENIQTFPKNFVANGYDTVTFTIQLKDACQNLIQFGGRANEIFGVLKVESRSDEPPTIGRRLQSNSSLENSTTIGPITNHNIEYIQGTIVDHNNGQYSATFEANFLGNFSLFLSFGPGCSKNLNFSSLFIFTESLIEINNNSVTCWSVAVKDAAVSIPFSTLAPTSLSGNPPTLDTAALTGIGVAVGVVTACGAIFVAFGIRQRNQWRKDKKFIEAGRLAALEKNTAYIGDNELDMLQNKLQSVLHALNAERAKKAKDENKEEVIQVLLMQRGELQEHVRRLKIKLAGGDPDAPEIQPGLASRVRKSFAARRVSLSSRLSLTGLEDGTLSIENPLFSRLRMSVSRKSVVQAETVLPNINEKE